MLCGAEREVNHLSSRPPRHLRSWRRAGAVKAAESRSQSDSQRLRGSEFGRHPPWRGTRRRAPTRGGGRGPGWGSPFIPSLAPGARPGVAGKSRAQGRGRPHPPRAAVAGASWGTAFRGSCCSRRRRLRPGMIGRPIIDHVVLMSS